jgi:hypothetical protein
MIRGFRGHDDVLQWMLDQEWGCVKILSRSLTEEDEGIECEVDDLMYHHVNIGII